MKWYFYQNGDQNLCNLSGISIIRKKKEEEMRKRKKRKKEKEERKTGREGCHGKSSLNNRSTDIRDSRTKYG